MAPAVAVPEAPERVTRSGLPVPFTGSVRFRVRRFAHGPRLERRSRGCCGSAHAHHLRDHCVASASGAAGSRATGRLDLPGNAPHQRATSLPPIRERCASTTSRAAAITTRRSRSGATPRITRHVGTAAAGRGDEDGSGYRGRSTGKLRHHLSGEVRHTMAVRQCGRLTALVTAIQVGVALAAALVVPLASSLLR